MWKFKDSQFYTSILHVLLLYLYAFQMCTQGNARGYLLRDTDSITPSNVPENIEYRQDYHECYITMHEIKRIRGKCVKIRDNFQGCVAGDLMDPFHQDCL